MNTAICPTCGCSLVRLGITNEKATPYRHNAQDHLFCCQGCVDVFVTDPRKYLEETGDLIVCPSCLAEKPRQVAVAVKVGGQEFHFCRCPYCTNVFQNNPDFYIRRLEGTIPTKGVLDHEECCVRPILQPECG